MRILCGAEISEANLATIDPDLGNPLLGMAVPTHPFEAALVVALLAGVLVVLSAGGWPKVGNPVVGAIPVPMVDQRDWLMASEHLPDDAMGKVKVAIDLDALVFPLGRLPCCNRPNL